MPWLLLLWLASLLPPAPADVHLADLHRFPPPCVVASALRTASDFRDYARSRESVEPHRAEAWSVVLDAAHLHRRPWELLAEAQHAEDVYGDRVPATSRLEALAELRKALGPRGYAEGRLPCPVPLWAAPQMP